MVKKVILPLLSLIIVGVAVMIIMKGMQQDQQLAAEIDRKRELAHELDLKKWELTNELNSLEITHGEETHGTGMVQLLALTLDEELYTGLFPAMQEKGITGVIGLSMEELPGLDRKITREQFDEMLEAGWTTCAVWADGGFFPFWMANFSRQLEEENILMPKAVYFPRGRYDDRYEETLDDYGIIAAIHHGEKGRSLIAGQTDEHAWKIGASEWNGQITYNTLRDLSKQGGDLVMTVYFHVIEEGTVEEEETPETTIEPAISIGFQGVIDFGTEAVEEDEEPSRDVQFIATTMPDINVEEVMATPEPRINKQVHFDLETFNGWYNHISYYLDSGKLSFETFEDAVNYRRGVDAGSEQAFEKIEEKRAELTAQIEEIEAQIREIYHNDSGATAQ